MIEADGILPLEKSDLSPSAPRPFCEHRRMEELLEMLDECKTTPLIVTSYDRLDVVLGLLAAQVWRGCVGGCGVWRGCGRGWA